MNILCILVIVNLLNFCYTFHLNNYQMNLINKLVQNPLLQNQERETVNNILYKAYEKWAIKQAINFKLLHKYKCDNIKTEELIFYSKIGLFKSIKKYNGKYNFINYSSIYVKSELLKLLTEKYSLSILSKDLRRKNKDTLSKIELNKYNHLLKTNYFSQYENWKLDLMFVNKNDILSKMNEKTEDNEKFIQLINNLTPFSKRILYLKYNSNNSSKPDGIISNKIISTLMCCSEETVRKELIKIKQMASTL